MTIRARPLLPVMAGLDPAIHEGSLQLLPSGSWMAGSSPAMTGWGEGG